MKKVDFKISSEVANVFVGDEFATMLRHPDTTGLIKVFLSIPIIQSHVALINDSGIAEVVDIDSVENSFYFRRLPFFETYVMCKILTDILNKNE